MRKEVIEKDTHNLEVVPDYREGRIRTKEEK